MEFLRKINPVLYFILFLIILFFFFGFNDVITSRPGSIHAWRQADCASMALNYYQDGMDFFNPELMQQNADGNTSGHNISEFPVVYYIVAALYHVFGYHEIIFRLLNLLIFFIGLVFLYKILLRFLGNIFWAVSVTLLFYSSAILVYYSPGFLPDTTALALVFPGWYYFFVFMETGKKKTLVISFLFFTMASLLKITAALSPLAITALLIIDYLGIFKTEKRKNIFNNKAAIILALGVFFVVNAIWLAWVFYYNNLHNTDYFGTRIWPVWKLTSGEFSEVVKAIRLRWLGEFMNREVQLIYLVLGVFIIWTFNRTNTILLLTMVFLVMGSVAFVVMFFEVLGVHDYYLINLTIFPLFILLTGFESFKRNYPRFYNSVYVKIAFSILILFALINTKSKHSERIAGWWEPYAKYENLNNLSGYLDSVGLKKTDKIVVIPDCTPSLSLYLVNRKGWTMMKFHPAKDVLKYKKLGAEYLIINGPEYVHTNDFDSIPKVKIGEKEGVFVYKLQ
ncbi:MAG: hypothetical protein A2W91_20085 [Bacteroidetes bacterium GWF2_38_335]|nr:MAG: hypothetical protein A2W91_20085 [Bacteroidetes bacterium GWF2_38_335]OFY81981.1 MAG: hypothetical protein A2281_09835 [Bacteroidetes bacterium RIFOXYA12_FULL_38_20]HBS86520.1 hypothetical protein [Bacteroidales bacterium]